MEYPASSPPSSFMPVSFAEAGFFRYLPVLYHGWSLGPWNREGIYMNEKIRIGAVSYLNSKPLIYDLDTLAPQAELILDYPSRLADQLGRGELEVALIPVIEYFRAGTYRLMPNIAVASHGPVLSVTLFSRVPWGAIRRVALDEGSRTSAALAQVLLRKKYGVQAGDMPVAAGSRMPRMRTPTRCC